MRLFVGVTDGEWYRRLAQQQPDEVNFWRPSSKTSFRALQPGEPFLFKLHSPRNYIVGGGFFVSYSRLPVSIAWLAFGEKNGVANAHDFLESIQKYRRDSDTSPDPMIGCIVLTAPFFLPEDQWIPIPADWRSNIVQGKGYDTRRSPGKELWEDVQRRLNMQVSAPADEASSEGDRYGTAYLTRNRLGQGAFRVLVTDAYQRRCAITGEKTLPVLEASHIKPYAQSGPHAISNGLLLRSDLHILFDRGYLTVDPEHRVVVSQKIREEYENGRHYYALEGQPLNTLPANPMQQPDKAFLTWHNENVFVT